MPIQWPKSFIPDEDEESQTEELSFPQSFIADEEEKKPDLLDKIKSALTPAEKIHPGENDYLSRIIKTGKKVWDKASEPLIDTPTKFAEEVSKHINPNSETKGIRGIGSAFVEGLGHAISGLSSPLNLALTASGIGAAARIPGAAFATKALSVPIVAEGSQNIYSGIRDKSWEEGLSGGLEAGLGVLGMRSGVHGKASKEPSIRQSREIPYKASGDLPSNMPERELSVRQPAGLPPDMVLPEEQDIFNRARSERVKKVFEGESPRYTQEDLAKAKIENERLSQAPAGKREKFVSPFDKKPNIEESKPIVPISEESLVEGNKITEDIIKQNPEQVGRIQRMLGVNKLSEASIKDLEDVYSITKGSISDAERKAAPIIKMFIDAKKGELESVVPKRVGSGSTIFEEPQAARTESGKIAIGADIKSLGKVLGTSLYKDDIAPIATKELLQNSIDAVRHLGTEGKIDVIFDRSKRLIHVIDNGKGLTRQELESVFTNLGSSGKREDASAAGGFGLAKAAPLLGGEHVEVSSITKDANGIFHEYTFKGTPDELLEGVDIKHRIVSPDRAQTGTKVSVRVPVDSDFYGSENFVKNLSKHSPDVQSEIRFGNNYAKGDYDPNDILLPVTRGGGKSIATLKSTSADVELIETHDSKRHTASVMKLHLSNNGMYQKTIMKYFNDEVPNLPSDIVVDIRSKVPEGHGDYPFTANREEMRGSVEKLVSKYIDDNIVKPGVGKRLDELKRLYSSMKEITVGRGEYPNTFGHKIAIYDPKGQITLDEMKSIISNPSFQTLAGNIAGTLKEALKVLENTAWTERLEKIGIIFEEGLHGIHIPNPGSGKSAILVNPFIAIEKMSPDEASANILHTILHELAHVEPSSPGHNESFTVRLGDIYGKFGARRSVEAQDNILKSIANPDTGIYNPEIQEVLSTYKESRGRTPTQDDLLSGTGIKSESSGKGQNPVSASNKPDGKRTSLGGIKPSKRPLDPNSGPYAEALDKLFSSLGKASENRAQQDIINKTERARRFAASAGVKDVGVKGAAQSLSKLKGEFEKVDVEKLKMSQPQVDSLFTAVKRAKLTEGEKARGFTALFKLMNGEGVPQRNELSILNDVFGNNFANKVTELHGGIGLVGMKLSKTANTMKTMMYSSDLSMGLRQGIGMVHKSEWRSAMVEQFKYLAKPEYFEAAMKAIEEHPKYSIAKESGLFISKPGGLLNGEEAFMDNYIGDIPKGVKSLYMRDVVDASERAYVGGLNKLRFDLFNNLTTHAENLGHKPFATEMVKNAKGEIVLDPVTRKPQTVTVPNKMAENIAKYINIYTGRGGLGQLEKIKGMMNIIFGSPRMISSRLTALNPKFYYNLDPFTRKEAIKSLLAVAAASTTINTLGALAGGKVSLDILSSDFMKTRFASGNVIDPSGSFQQPVVAAARMIGELNRMASRRKLAQGEQTIPQIAGNFLTNKLSPITGLAYDLATAKQYTGGGDYTDRFNKKKNIVSETGKRFVSIFSQDMWDLLKTDPSFAEAVGIPPLILFGAGEQNYPERKPKSAFKKLGS